MFNVEDITQNSYIIINKSEKKVISKVKYCSVKAPGEIYYKLILEDHGILVIAGNQRSIYYGSIIPSLIDVNLPFPPSITYDSHKFDLITEDYQIVLEVCFGDPINVEGEVYFADYSNVDNDKECISLALVSRSKKRADVFSRQLNIEELVVKNNV